MIISYGCRHVNWLGRVKTFKFAEGSASDIFFARLLWTAYHRVSRCPVKTRQEEEEGREGKVRVSQQQVCDETARPKSLTDKWKRSGKK